MIDWWLCPSEGCDAETEIVDVRTRDGKSTTRQCTECDWSFSFNDCPECESNQSQISNGQLEAARSAGAHDEFIAFVAEYPDSSVAGTLETAISLDALDEFQSISGSFVGSLWEHGVKKSGNPDTENAKKIRELFDRDRWPKWMQQQYDETES